MRSQPRSCGSSNASAAQRRFARSIPLARGHGVGELILRAVEAEAEARGVAAVDVNTAAPNEAARRFYERHGYRLDLVTYRKPLRG